MYHTVPHCSIPPPWRHLCDTFNSLVRFHYSVRGFEIVAYKVKLHQSTTSNLGVPNLSSQGAESTDQSTKHEIEAVLQNIDREIARFQALVASEDDKMLRYKVLNVLA